jgi:AraC-like DNA-binding protein
MTQSLDQLLSSLQLRVLVASRSVIWPTWVVEDHPLPYNKIYYVHQGTVSISIDGAAYELTAGEFAILPAKHRNACSRKNETLEKTWIHFDARVLGLVDLFDVLTVPALQRVPPESATAGLLGELVQEFHAANRPFRELATNGMLALILAQVLRTAQSSARQHEVLLRGPGDRIGKVLQHIAEHFAEELTLDSLAAVVHLHPTYFSNTFRKSTGMAPMAFVQRFRIEHAKGLLASSDVPVMDVAARVGFVDPYHFSRVFKKLVGTAPSAFQESVRRTNPH